MILPERRDIRIPFPELFEWLEHPMFGFRPFGQVIRVEDYVADGKYVLRAELPGMDPDTEIEVTVDGGALHIRAEKAAQDGKEPRRSEFSYGALYRSVTLPTGAKTEEITATYKKGVLEVAVPLAEPKKVEGKRVAVTH